MSVSPKLFFPAVKGNQNVYYSLTLHMLNGVLTVRNALLIFQENATTNVRTRKPKPE
jgi:hypothetical protein